MATKSAGIPSEVASSASPRYFRTFDPGAISRSSRQSRIASAISVGVSSSSPAPSATALTLVNAVADGAGDEELTPTEMAEAIRDCLELREIAPGSNVRKYLGEALDATSDGMPADFVAMTLYAALGALGESRSED